MENEKELKEINDNIVKWLDDNEDMLVKNIKDFKWSTDIFEHQLDIIRKMRHEEDRKAFNTLFAKYEILKAELKKKTVDKFKKFKDNNRDIFIPDIYK